jgi:signal transduction histidine kinase
MFRSTGLRLAIFYTAAFAVSVASLGVLTVAITRAALEKQFDDRIRADSAAIIQEYRVDGLGGVIAAVHQRDATPGALDFGLQTAGGAPMAGALAQARARVGWSVLKIQETPNDEGPNRILVTLLPGGYRVLVGDDTKRITTVDGVVAKSFGAAFLGVVLLGGLLGYGLSRGVNRRIALISGTAEAIIDGDLTRRVPVKDDDDELDRLAATLNRMLDRIANLMDSLRQVSTNIAHDLRTPLTRLRHRLETSLAAADVGERTQVVESGLADLDGILGLFAALLRISQIEAGALRAGLRSTDLTELAHTVVEAFAPSAEDAGGSLTLEADASLVMEGDPELLTQMLVNMVENALRHAGAGASITVRCERIDRAPVLSVIDDGPGVPASERDQLFDRFHRLEASRSTPGSGLGLALVAAVAKLHGARASLHDAAPGLEIRIAFPAPVR